MQKKAKPKRKKAYVSVHVPLEIQSALKALAAADGRSLSNYVNILLTRVLHTIDQ